VNEELVDDGISINGLWGTAWVLGLLAAASLIRLLSYAANGEPVQTEFFVWSLLGAIAAAFSACCAVLTGIKSAERRLSRLANTSRV
jgi:uncharacterized membrane protein